MHSKSIFGHEIQISTIFPQVKGINYSLESFIGPINETTSKYMDAIQKNKSSVSETGRCAVPFFFHGVLLLIN